MTEHTAPRALERRILRLVEEGVAHDEIARRFRRSPDMIHRIIVLARLARSEVAASAEAAASAGVEVLRPLERRVLRWRDDVAADYAEIGARFRRSADHVQRIETLARHKLAMFAADAMGREPDEPSGAPPVLPPSSRPTT
jgi:DNA-directed RNA polymerase specialized sigma24 family protein